MASTARNMLKILYDRKCGAVVMVSDLRENGKVRYHQYHNDNDNKNNNKTTTSFVCLFVCLLQ